VTFISVEDCLFLVMFSFYLLEHYVLYGNLPDNEICTLTAVRLPSLRGSNIFFDSSINRIVDIATVTPD